MSGPSSDAAVRSLWINGLSSEVSVDALQARLPDLNEAEDDLRCRHVHRRLNVVGFR